MSFTLYEINDMYLNLIDLIESGADEEDIKVALDNIDDELEEKADSYAVVIKRLEATEAMIQEEEKRLHAKRKTITNNIKNMKNRLEEAMILHEKKKFKTDKFSFNIQKNRAGLKILNEAEIPEKYKEEKIEIVIDTNKIIDEIKSGLEVQGAELIQTESLRIR